MLPSEDPERRGSVGTTRVGQDSRWPRVELPGLWAGDRAKGRIFIGFHKLISKVTSLMYINTLASLKRNQKGDICPRKYKRPYKPIIIDTMLSPRSERYESINLREG